MLFDAHLCNHIILQQSGGGTWDTSLYTVRCVGSGSRDVDAWRANVSVRRGSGSKYDYPGSWQHCGDSMLWHTVPRLLRTDPRVSQRISIGTIRPIRVDHTDFFKWLLKPILTLFLHLLPHSSHKSSPHHHGVHWWLLTKNPKTPSR